MKKMFKKVMLFFFAVAVLAGCNDKPISSELPEVAATDIVFKASGYNEGKDFKVIRGQTVIVQATVYPKEATIRTVTWASNNYDLEVTDLGNNKAQLKVWDVGTFELTVTAGEYSEILPVFGVTEIMPQSISVPTEIVEVRENTRVEVDVKLLPEDATNPGINVTISPLVTAKPNNKNGLVYIDQDDVFYLKEMEAAIGDTYKVEVVSQRDPAVKASFTAEITPYDVESVTFTKTDVTVSLNDPTFRMTPKYEPEQTSYLRSTFSSLNPDICDIDPVSGKLLPKKVGVATVRATSEMSDDIYGDTTVTITAEPTDYLIRGFTKTTMDELPVSTIVNHDMEFNKVAFAEWKAGYSEDTWYSHALDGGWAKWIVGQDYWDDNNEPDDDRMNTMVYNKVRVPEEASLVQFVFRSHLHPNDTSLVRIVMIEEDYTIHDMTNGWIEFDQTFDKFINFDMNTYKGKNLTWIIQQDQVYDIFDKNEEHCCKGVHLQFRQMRFDVEGVTITEDPFYELKDISEGS